MSEGETTPKVPEPQTSAKRGAKPASDTGEKVQATANRPPGSRGRLLAGFALLVALVAAGIGGYLYYLLVYRSPLAPVDARLSSMEETLALQGSEVRALSTTQRDTLQQFALEQQAQMKAAEERIASAVNDLAIQAPPSSREWKIAEVAYLLRIANHRLLMERDSDGALQLLHAADAILLELDDFGLYPVRARLADEILALENVETNDVQGLYLRLEAVKGELERLPLKIPAYLEARSEAQSPSGDDQATLWQRFLARLTDYLRIRRVEGEVKPLLAPDEAVYLELNLRLMLERAQLAALRREQVIYQQSLTSASDWLQEYLDPSEPRVQRVLVELDELARVNLNLALPDISGSLMALRKAAEGES